MARLYDCKQSCLWQNVILGKSRPFGLITDFWRRVEVGVIGALLFYVHYIV